ncbi:lipopolysaccharide A protein [Grimontia sp. S25]|uniref:Lipopolysaccharide A protein n=1 Tax=Grimontia sedimenti TaxID=2711294 RepID=A0A6M1RG02_9GAMM|nr:lipopolysaccharide A protein [Grimontia sedimenti]
MKFPYYSKNALKALIPNILWHKVGSFLLAKITSDQRASIEERVSYYNKLTVAFAPKPEQQQFSTVAAFKKTRGWTYFFDIKDVVHFFDPDFSFNYINGDVTHVPNTPSFVKSRPIGSMNGNSVLLKLNKVRHFAFVKDKRKYQEKKDMVAWRGVGYQPHRQTVIKAFYNHPMCNIGQTKPCHGAPWEKEEMSKKEQLAYKFLLAIEGNDVATNLKWAMSSNSLVMMSRPKFETWFMEGRLQPGIHYVELKDDYSDLIEKVNYYLSHEDEALGIINNAHRWVDQFRDPQVERMISLLVAERYFELTRKTS